MKIYYHAQVADRVRKLCIQKDWFDCGTNRQYDKMFDMLERPDYSVRDIALVIWICTYQAPLNEIIKELKKIEYLDHIRYKEEYELQII